MNKQLLILGAGGHAKVVIDTALAMGMSIVGLVDDNTNLWGKKLLGFPILGGFEEIKKYSQIQLIHGIGNNKVRRKLAEQFCQHEFASLIHPRAYLGKDSSIGRGSVVFANAIIQPCAKIGDHCIINTAATVDHDCIVEDFVHLAPGTHLTANVEIKSGVFLGAGCIAIPGTKIGSWTTVGAGSTIIKSLEAGSLAVGTPAKIIKQQDLNGND